MREQGFDQSRPTTARTYMCSENLVPIRARATAPPITRCDRAAGSVRTTRLAPAPAATRAAGARRDRAEPGVARAAERDA